MNVTVFGSNGMLGRYVCKYLAQEGVNVTSYTRSDLDIYQCFCGGTLVQKINSMCDGVVINCAGITNKRPGVSVEEMYVVNSLFPMFLDAEIKKVVHISTDCVFTGLKGNYSVVDKKDSRDDYGLSKNFGENLPNSLVIRTSIIGHGRSSGLLDWVLEQEEKSINGYIHHFWNGVTCFELAKIIYRILLGPWESRIIQVTSPQWYSKYELVKSIVRVYDTPVNVEPWKTANVDRTLIGTVVSSLNIDEQLVEMKEFDRV